MCTLRNLSYRTQEVDDPNYDQVPAAGQQLEAALPILLLLLSLPPILLVFLLSLPFIIFCFLLFCPSFLPFFFSLFCPSHSLYFASLLIPCFLIFSSVPLLSSDPLPSSDLSSASIQSRPHSVPSNLPCIPGASANGGVNGTSDSKSETSSTGCFGAGGKGKKEDSQIGTYRPAVNQR